MNSVAIVIPTFNQKEVTADTISKLKKQTVVPDIVVVDNHSTDDTYSFLQKEFPNITIIRTRANCGGSGSLYLGAKYAFDQGYEWILLSDNDAIPIDKDLIEELVKEASPSCVTQPFNQDEDIDENSLFLAFHYGCYHRSIFEKVGYPVFDFFLLHDDTEFTHRLQKVVGIKKLTSVKYSHPLKRFYPPSRQYFMVRNELHVLSAHGSFFSSLKTIKLRINLLIAALLLGETDYFTFGIRGMWDFAWGVFDNEMIKKPGTAKQTLQTESPSSFKEQFNNAFVVLESRFNQVIGFPSIGRVKSKQAVDAFRVGKPFIQGFLFTNATLLFSVLFPVIVTVEDVAKSEVLFREYKPRHPAWVRLLLMVLWNILLLPLTVLCIVRVSLPRTLKTNPREIDWCEAVYSSR